MYTLFISTFDKEIIIGLIKNGKLISCDKKESLKNHSIYVVPMIKNILDSNSIDTSYLNEIIVVNGPGSFTGVRIGVTIAKTLAYTLNIPIKTITSLKAYAVSKTSKKNKLVVIPDMKGKYIGYFNYNNELIDDYIYLNNIESEKHIKNKSSYLVKDMKLDINKIYNYLKGEEGTICHLVNPVYIKGIEVLNGK